MVQEESKGKCDLVTIANCGHYASLEQPEEFSQIIGEIAEDVF